MGGQVPMAIKALGSLVAPLAREPQGPAQPPGQPVQPLCPCQALLQELPQAEVMGFSVLAGPGEGSQPPDENPGNS